ncbi:MAG: hypothetical protein BWY71_00263 [Planctomycetes bacterium ADurb.Bin412]|nr:MAG: hypothetical protein BWY71_00263 [Planctomycetes bacterium ADurb.Bin412]
MVLLTQRFLRFADGFRLFHIPLFNRLNDFIRTAAHGNKCLNCFRMRTGYVQQIVIQTLFILCFLLMINSAIYTFHILIDFLFCLLQPACLCQQVCLL